MSQPKHRGASPSTETHPGVCTGRHCVGAGLVLFHRGFMIPLHPTAHNYRKKASRAA